MDRRTFLSLIGTGLAAAVAGCSSPEAPAAVASTTAVKPRPAPLLGPPPRSARIALPGGTLSTIPGPGQNLALTIDDGSNSEVVAAYIQLAKDTGARLTFFVTAYYKSWTENAPELRPLVDSGQIQLANHTWDHKDLTTLSPGKMADQFRRSREFLRNTYGVDGGPYFRPPYGAHNPTVDRIAGNFGYTVPTLWFGTLGDAGPVSEQQVLDSARQYFNPQSIVIGHANQPAVTHVYGELVDIIRERKLALVTLDDVFTA